MSPRLRKATLTAHVACSVGWLGAVAGFLALAVAGLVASDASTVSAAYIAMELITMAVVVPLALGSVLTGVVQSLGTEWGLLRHYWVLVKLVITVLATAVLLLQLGPIGDVAAAAARATVSLTDLGQARLSLVVHSGGGLVVLLVPMVLSVFKPKGMTRYGQRRRRLAADVVGTRS